MAIRLKARSTTPGAIRLADNVLSQLIGVADIRKGVQRGDDNLGTLVGTVDTGGAYHASGIIFAGTYYASGILSAAASYSTVGVFAGGSEPIYLTGTFDGTTYRATGVIYGAGTYATEASRNSTTAAAGDIVSGHSVTLLGVTTAGTLDMSLWAEISGIVSPTLVVYGQTVYNGGPNGSFIGISDGTTTHATGLLSGLGYAATGILDALDNLHASGIIDSLGSWAATGIFDGTDTWANGTLSSAGSYNATGVIYGAGLYATETSRNSKTAGAAQILTGYSVTIASVTTNGSLPVSGSATVQFVGIKAA